MPANPLFSRAHSTFYQHVLSTLKVVQKKIKPPSALYLSGLKTVFINTFCPISHGTTSGNLSYKVSEIIVETANEAFDLHWTAQEEAQYIQKIQHPVRKLAHMTEYFLLAVSVSFPLYVYGVRGIWLLLLAGGFCVGFAALDEYHQSFVAGRGPSKRDVAIDSIGVGVGVILVQIICFIGRVTIFRPLAKKKKKRRV